MTRARDTREGPGRGHVTWRTSRYLLLGVVALHLPVLLAVALGAGRGVVALVFAGVLAVAPVAVAPSGRLARALAPPAPPDGPEDPVVRVHEQEAERIKSELIAVVSHELRTPLTSIRGYARTLEQRGDRMDRTTVLACLRSIEGQAVRLERIVDNLLVASGSVRSQPDETADVSLVAAAVAADLDRVPGAGGHRIVVDVTPGLRARISRAAVARVLENLLDNALKFAAPGTDVVVAGRRAGGEVVLEVRDRGVPLGEADLDRIFAEFVQGDSSDSRPVNGLGLGLAIVRRIVEAHGGRVEAGNVGSEVVLAVRLPAAGPLRQPAVVALGQAPTARA